MTVTETVTETITETVTDFNETITQTGTETDRDNYRWQRRLPLKRLQDNNRNSNPTVTETITKQLHRL